MSDHVAIAQHQDTGRSQQGALSVVNFQRQAVNHDETTVLAEWKVNTLSRGDFARSRFGHDFSQVPAHTDMTQRTRPLLRTGTMVQRYPVNGDADSTLAEPTGEATSTTATTEPEEESAAVEETAAPALLVEDSVTELAPGQMRKSEFMAQLRAEVTRTAEAAMAGTGRTTADCPYLDYWFDYYRQRDARHGERALRRYAPEASRATTAREYIPIIAQRVHRSVQIWARTGEITGIPEGMPIGMSGLGLLGSIGSLISGIGSIFFKARNGGARRPDDPRAIQSQLGSGQPLNSGVRSRMESAFGRDFSHVRAHTDTTAAGLSNRLNARAFTVGKHVAFGAGEYRPGTLVGDALIAHEMAHVVQQRGASSCVTPMPEQGARHNVLEKDADLSALGAVVSIWDRVKGIPATIVPSALPRLRSGLQLQRCGASTSQVRQQPQTVDDLAAMTPWRLSQMRDEDFDSLSGSRPGTGEPGVEDYRRAARLARAVFQAYNVTFDIDNPPPTPVGREPTPEELRILDANLEHILASGGGNIRSYVSGPGGRGVPMQGAARTPTLRGRVRITRTHGEFVAKMYQLQMLLSSPISRNISMQDREVEALWQEYDIQHGSLARITDQERRIAIFNMGGVVSGFYCPPDDIFYFPPTVDLTTPAMRDIARHETIHFLGGRERTRQAFVRRFGIDNYFRYWEPFEEGITELLTQESRPAGQRAPSRVTSTSRSTTPVTVEGEGATSEIPRSSTTTVIMEAGGSQYEPYVQWLRSLMAMDSRNRDLLLQAFFSGNVPETVFQLLIQNPPPSR